MILKIGLMSIMFLVCLIGCAQEQVVVPGKREPISAVVATAKTEDNFATIKSGSMAFIPPQSIENNSWPQSHGTPNTRVLHPSLDGSLTLQWSTSIGKGDQSRNRITAEPIVYNNQIFTVDSLMVLSATSKKGEILWQKDLTPDGENKGDVSGAGLAAGAGTIFVATAYGLIHAIDPASGQTKWTQILLGSGSTRPTYYDGLVYLVSNDESAWAIDARTGRVNWTLDNFSDVNNLISNTAPSLSEKFAVFGYGSGVVQAVFRQSGLTVWTTSISGGRSGRALSIVDDIVSSPVIDGSTVYVANGSGRITGLNLNSGERLWGKPFGTVGNIWPAGDSLFLVNDLSQLVRMNKDNGDVIWSVQLPNFVKVNPKKSKEVVAHFGPIIAGSKIVLISSDEKLRVYDPQDGSIISKIEIPGGATSNPVIANNVLYFVSRKGDLHAFR
ncbi:PQQ-like beta-propeller repeat protein [Paracoccaceae bacterium]|nr:PQQ-like beta-propeller repeat protein [Paracoccaceae bacterium]MDC0899924.1 PQQ-like beta-propeller repeat protein [Paracoccaceae bacterium]